MKTFSTISILLVITLFFSCSEEKNPIPISNSDGANIVSSSILSKTEKEDLAIGEKIYNDNCIKCHGLDGKLKHSGAKDLSISTLNIDERIKVIASAQTIGSRFHAPRFQVDLSDNDIKAVAEYSQTLRK